MRITVWGAGAIGGIAGACLARAGHEVVLVDAAAEQRAAIAADGFTVEERDGAWSCCGLPALSPGAVCGPLGVTLLAVKAQHIDAALAHIEPLLACDGAVVCLQNGLGAWRVAERIGAERTLACVVHWAADLIARGRARRGARQRLPGRAERPAVRADTRARGGAGDRCRLRPRHRRHPRLRLGQAGLRVAAARHLTGGYAHGRHAA
jgi:ketopantoate reductase